MKLTYKIYQDEMPENPRTFCEYETGLALYHKRYVLGDEKPLILKNGKRFKTKDLHDLIYNLWIDYATEDEKRTKILECVQSQIKIKDRLSLYKRAYNYYSNSIHNVFERLFNRDLELFQTIDTIELPKAITWLPVYGYDHGSLTINTKKFSCPWDSGFLGIIYSVNPSAELLEFEIKEYDQYLTGNVYWYEIQNENGDVIDSCSGFYGIEQCESAVKRAIEHYNECYHL